MNRILFVALILVLWFPMSHAFAANQAKGTLTVGGKPINIAQVYAFAVPGTFDPKADDVVVLLCDAAVPAAGVRDTFERRDLVKAGKLHCVQQTISSKQEVINFRVEDSHFKMAETGGSTEQRFEAKTLDGKTVAGRAFTRSPQKSFEDIPYTYDITFSAAIEPKK